VFITVSIFSQKVQLVTPLFSNFETCLFSRGIARSARVSERFILLEVLCKTV